MRLIMMGTGPFAVPVFRVLLESSHEMAALVTRPVRRARGRCKTPSNPMRQEAEAKELPVLDPEDVNSAAAREQLAAFAATEPIDVLVVCDYGQILSSETLSVARRGGINLHGSLLPRYRGAAPVNWALYHGEAKTGVSVIHMSPKLDAGPILATAKMAIDPDETAEQLEPRLAALGVSPVLESLSLLESWDGESTLGAVQDPHLATRAPRLKKTDGLVNWYRTAQQIKNHVRAFQPWPGVFTYWQRGPQPSLRLILNKVSVLEEAFLSDQAQPPGAIVHRDTECMCVATGEGVLSIEQIQPAGKRVLQIAEFLRGYPIRVGDRLDAADT